MDFGCSKLGMLEDAIAILEWVTHEGTGDQRSYDAWEALRTIEAAGGDPDALRDFWIACKAPRNAPDRHPVYGTRTTCMNRICRSLGIERRYRMVALSPPGPTATADQR